MMPSAAVADRLDAIHNGDRVPVLETIRDQGEELLRETSPTVTCPCGASGPVHESYRCYMCSIYFCPRCARDHFRDGGDTP